MHALRSSFGPIKIKSFLLSLLAFATLLPLALRAQNAPAPAPVAVDLAVTSAALWEIAPDAFCEANAALGFRWISTVHDTAQSTLKGATLFGLPVYQTLVRFDGGKPVEVTAFFFNRGDAGEIDRAAYDDLVRKAAAALSTATKTNFTARGKDASNAVKAEGLIWQADRSIYLLEYSFTRDFSNPNSPFRAEFVRLRVTPRAQRKSLIVEALAASKKPGPFRGPDHVVTDAASGDVAIQDVPMVDQGEKGYCVVAASERVLRYYGIKVDENELAQLANSSATGGTSVNAMTESLKKLTARFKIRVRTLIQSDVRTLLATVNDYNQAARRAKASPVETPGHVLDVGEIYGQMKGEILREARTKNRSTLSGFERNIMAHVDKGTPLLWSVMLGLLPEPHLNLTKPGGHMRLIIGYNQKTDEILYTDSWGMGHELKRMPAADAWTITTGLATIEPL